jgi:hypothetical protein
MADAVDLKFTLLEPYVHVTIEYVSIINGALQPSTSLRMLGSSGTISKKSKGMAKWQRHFIGHYGGKCTKKIAAERTL